MKFSQNKKHYIWRAAQIISRQGVTFIIFLLSARFLSPYDLGIYSYVMAVISLLSLICDFGISVSVSKISAESAHRQDNRHTIIVSNALPIAFLISFLITLGIFLFARTWLGASFGYVMLASPLAFLMPAVSILDGYLRGQRKFRMLSIINICTGVLFTIIALFATKYYAINGAIAVQVALYLVLLLLLINSSGRHHFNTDRKLIRELTQSSLIIGFISVGYFLYTKMDIIILKEFGQIAEIGFYEMLNKIIMIIGLPFMVFATVSGPNVSKLYVSQKWSLILKLLKRYIALSFKAASAVALLALIPTVFIMRSLFPGFGLYQNIFIVSAILFTFIFHMVADVVGNAFIIYTGFAKLNLYLILAFGLMNVTLDLILIPAYGFNGIIITKLIVVLGFAASLNIIYFFNVSKLSRAGESSAESTKPSC